MVSRDFAFGMLQHLAGLLSTRRLTLSPPGGDGRTRSTGDEEIVADEVERLVPDLAAAFCVDITFERKGARRWFDIALTVHGADGSDVLLPINIKVSEFKAPDNLSSKLAIYYAAKGCVAPGIAGQTNWKKYLKRLALDPAVETERDYYFLVVNRNDTSDVFAQALRRLCALTTNGNNLPFQCDWKHNRQPVARDYETAAAFLIGHLGWSLVHRAEAGVIAVSLLGHYLDQVAPPRPELVHVRNALRR